MTPKIQRIAPKFMRNEESESLNSDNSLAHLHIFWGAKEALYKAYGKKKLDFKAHIFVEPFAYLPKGETIGKVKKEDFEANFNIYFEKIENYYLVFAEACEPKTLM
jgi:phosphopantetheinyl transferase (holo-ACP synthase)